jgi:hypothetical protein
MGTKTGEKDPSIGQRRGIANRLPYIITIASTWE